MEDENIEEVLVKLKNQRRQTLFDRRVTLLKAEDAFNELGGEDDYELSLSAIVTAYPKGITLTRVRELLPDSKALDTAKETLKSKGLIEVGSDKRSPLLKPVAPTKSSKPENTTSDNGPASPSIPAKKSTNPADDDGQE